jgi:sulfite reductase (NADPH) flavoprotein alpha-component
LKSNDYYHKIKSTEATAVDARLKEAADKKAKKAVPAAKPAAPKPAPAGGAAGTAAATAAKIEIPADAPFTPEQREWLSKFLSTVSVGAGAAPTVPKSAEDLAKLVAPTAAPTADAPWHDPSLGMQQRIDLAKSKPFADKLMAAMAQTDCHACGYDCRGYADAIASGAESDLSLCLPGEAETQQMLEKLTKEAGKA